MHITDIFQLSTGTIVDLSEDVSAVVGKYLILITFQNLNVLILFAEPLVLSSSDYLFRFRTVSSITTDSIHFYRVKGTSTEFWNSLLVEKTENLSIGQEVYFCEKVQEDE